MHEVLPRLHYVIKGRVLEEHFPVKDGEFLERGYEYFHLELGAVSSSSLINNRGVLEY